MILVNLMTFESLSSADSPGAAVEGRYCFLAGLPTASSHVHLMGIKVSFEGYCVSSNGLVIGFGLFLGSSPDWLDISPA